VEEFAIRNYSLELNYVCSLYSENFLIGYRNAKPESLNSMPRFNLFVISGTPLKLSDMLTYVYSRRIQDGSGITRQDFYKPL